MYKRAKESHREAFRQLCYINCESSDPLRAEFIKLLNEYNDLPPVVVNEIDFDVNADLQNAVRAKYSIDLSIGFEWIDINKIYFDNKEWLIQKASLINVNRNLVDQFLNENVTTESLLYFGDETESIIQKLKVWVGETPKSGSVSNIPNGKRLSFGEDILVYNDFVELKTKVDLLLNNAVGVTQNTIRISKTNLKPASKSGNRPGKTGGRRLAMKEDIEIGRAHV